MTEYIITEEQLKRACDQMTAGGYGVSANYIDTKVRSRPYNPQAERDLPHLTSTELLLVAHDEWKCRQERKHYDDEVPWTSGWISGFLTSRKWANEKVAKLREGKDGE